MTEAEFYEDFEEYIKDRAISNGKDAAEEFLCENLKYWIKSNTSSFTPEQLEILLKDVEKDEQQFLEDICSDFKFDPIKGKYLTTAVDLLSKVDDAYSLGQNISRLCKDFSDYAEAPTPEITFSISSKI